MVKLGSNGEIVKQLQSKLGLTLDGVFGPNTEKTLKEWQTKNGLISDGIAGQATLEKMGINFSPVNETVSTPKVEGLKLDKLKGLIPDLVISQIPETAIKFNITNSLRLSHFLAQCSHESGGFKAVKENLNYSADGLKKIFPKYFPGNLSESYARNPEKIASLVYGNRMGNGNELTKEGYLFCGRGYIQLTGKDNYSKFDKTVDDDIMKNPELVATKYPLASAAFFFDSNKLWSICDKGSDDSTVIAVTKRVNGGTIGLDHRLKEFKKIYSLLS